MEIKTIISKLVEKKDLTLLEAETLMEEIVRGEVPFSQIASILTALHMKGESTQEILGFIKVLRKHMVTVKTDGVVIDTCGTGGDGSGTFNISTVVAFVVAGAGVAVAKHGNRSASSLCGSADVLEALGVNINRTPEQAEKLLQETNFTFLFAPLYHPAMKHVVPVRKELGIRTVFNFLGPFLNPASVKKQIVGVPNKNVAEKLANVAMYMDYEHLLIVTSSDGLDEIGTYGQTYGYEICGKTIKKIIINPQTFGIPKSSKRALEGGTASENAKIILDILRGEKSPKRDIVILNSAFALCISGKVGTVDDGIRLASQSIDLGKAKEVLEESI
ncbi:anthranilate phosphoribosyltransferase [Candidatus Gottesmanbacteria bacterium]|nr:anthranilate phosphoribosyltransferase [Candidatus Gottesmanbacteria bacterium]